MNKVKSFIKEDVVFEGSQKYTITFEDGWSGSMWSKSQLNYEVGAVVEGDRLLDAKGRNRFKLSSGGFKGGSPKNSKGMMVGAAINNAVAMFVGGKIEKTQIEPTADWLCSLAVKLEDKWK